MLPTLTVTTKLQLVPITIKSRILHLIVNGSDEISHFLVLVVVVHPGVVHDGVVAAEDVEAEAGRRPVAVEERAREQPRRGPERVAACIPVIIFVILKRPIIDLSLHMLY